MERWRLKYIWVGCIGLYGMHGKHSMGIFRSVLLTSEDTDSPV